MNTVFRSTELFMAAARRDLERPHPFAHERVGFIATRAASAGGHLLLFAETYYPVADDEYVDDPTAGAMLNQEAFRKALEIALLRRTGMFHVHMHTFPGRLWFSRFDLSEQQKYVPDFFKVQPKMPHGALVLSPKNATGRVWTSPKTVEPLSEIHVAGTPTLLTWPGKDGSTSFDYVH